jgi:hypothetical protein
LSNVKSAEYRCGNQASFTKITDVNKPEIPFLRMGTKAFSCEINYTNMADQEILGLCKSNTVELYTCNPGDTSTVGCDANTAKRCDASGEWEGTCNLACAAPDFKMNDAKTACECVNGGRVASNCARCATGSYFGVDGKCVPAPETSCEVGLYDVNSPSNLLSGALEKSKVLFKYKLVNVLSAKYTCSNDKELVTPAEEAKNNISTGSATLDLGSLVPGSEGLNCSVDYVDLGNVSKKCPATTNIVSIYACDPKATPLPTQSCTAANATSAVRTCVNAGPATGTWSVDCIPTVCAADSSLNATKTACEKNSCQGLIADKHAEPCAGFNTKVKTADIKTTLVNNCNLANSCEYQCSNGYYLIANTGLCEESVCNLKWADTKAEIKVLVGNSKVAYKNRFVKDYSECDTFKETRTCKFDGKVMSLDGQNVNSTCEACANGKVPNADGSQCVEAPVNGACGIAKTSGKEYPTAPNVASELCDKGTASAVTGGASGGVNTGWSWTCKGSTTDGGQGTTETCSAKFKYNKVCKDATRFIEKGFQTCSIDVNSTESCSSCGVDQIYCLASSQCDTVCTTGNYFNATQAICESTTCVSSWSDNGSKFTLENGKSQLIYSK